MPTCFTEKNLRFFLNLPTDQNPFAKGHVTDKTDYLKSNAFCTLFFPAIFLNQMD
jgi:hypothetical protein